MPFSHERLKVYQEAIQFVAWTQKLLLEIPSGFEVRSQLDRASTSIPLNIAEGNAKFSKKDRARFLQYAHGSATECAACLDVIAVLELKTSKDIEPGKERLDLIVKMLLGLLDRCGSRMVEEEAESYGNEPDLEADAEEEAEEDFK